MKRKTGTYKEINAGGEQYRAFVPYALPPKQPALKTDGEIDKLHDEAAASLERLSIAGEMIPSPDWYLYGFVRKEALISSQIEGTQATMIVENDLGMSRFTEIETDDEENPKKIVHQNI